MTDSRFLWSVINPSLFTLEEITVFLEVTDRTCDQLLTLREQMIKSGIPTFQLGTAIRELQHTRNLLLLSGFKKFRTDGYIDEDLLEISAQEKDDQPGWRRGMKNFLIRCRGLIGNRHLPKRKKILEELPQTINLGECAAFPKNMTLPAG